MKKIHVFIILVIAQLVVPAWMIASQEKVLRVGESFKFKTAPVDPYDIFRGRYVSLSIEQLTVKYFGDKQLDHGQVIYIPVENNNEGYAVFKDALLRPPPSGAYIRTRVMYQHNNEVHFDLPFARFYMNEKKAPRAEQLYRDFNREEDQDAYIKVRILNGRAVTEDLYLGDKRITEYF